MGNPWDVKFNPFIGTGVGGSQRIGGGQPLDGKPKVGTQQGGSAVDRELADMRRFLQPNNGTGQLQPFLAEKQLFTLA